MTELLRNFWTRQSLPWMAVLELVRGIPGSDAVQALLTSIGYLCHFVALEAVPTLHQRLQWPSIYGAVYLPALVASCVDKLLAQVRL
jgi:hypothetical protein